MNKIDDSEQEDENISSVSWDEEQQIVIYHCKGLDKPMIADNSIISKKNKEENECDLCGSHGTESITISCECGIKHTAIVDVW